MKAIIKESFSRKEAANYKGICVTPQSFHLVKSWEGLQVEGLDYYVDKAVKLGAVAINKPTRGRPKKQS